MAQFTTLIPRDGRPVNDIDTDQIIPAQFLEGHRQERSRRRALLQLALQRRQIAEARFRHQ